MGASRRLEERIRERKQRRRDMFLLAASMLLHIAIFLILPGLARPADIPVRLIVQLDTETPEFIAPKLAESNSKSSSAGGGNPAAASAGQPVVQPQSTPARASHAEAQPSQSESASSQQTASQQNPANNNSANSATEIVSPQRVVVPESTEQAAPQQPVKKEVTPQTNKTQQPSPKQPAVGSGSSNEKPKPQVNKTADDAPQEPKPEPAVNTPASEAPEKPAEPKVSSPGDPSPQKQHTPSVGTTGDPSPSQPAQGAGENGPDVNLPTGPPGPSQSELDMLGDYGDAALKRILSQARNPEVGGEGTVTFEFDVSSRGVLIDVRILDDAGHELLGNDLLEASRAAFNEKHEIIPFPRDVTVKEWTFRRKVKYPLW